MTVVNRFGDRPAGWEEVYSQEEMKELKNQPFAITGTQSENAKYYRQFPWQLFCTFTFPRRFRNGDAETRWVWPHFINELERTHRDTVGRLVAEESRHAYGQLAGIRLHYHALFTSQHPISEPLLKELWRKYAGNGRKLIDVRQYDPSRGAVEYCLKLHGTFDGEIDFFNLDLYKPGSETNWKGNSASRRRLRRHMQRRPEALAA